MCKGRTGKLLRDRASVALGTVEGESTVEIGSGGHGAELRNYTSVIIHRGI